MAVTNVHTIHQGTYNAIAYIINPNKTGDGRYVISNLCVSSAQGAAEQFRETSDGFRKQIADGTSLDDILPKMQLKLLLHTLHGVSIGMLPSFQ